MIPGEPTLGTATHADWHHLWWTPILVIVLCIWIEGTAL